MKPAQSPKRRCLVPVREAPLDKAWLRHHYDDFRVEEMCVGTQQKLAWMCACDIFLAMTTEADAIFVSDDIQLEFSTLLNALRGPAFTCDLLVDTTCHDQCDTMSVETSHVEWTQFTVGGTPLCVQCHDESDNVETFAARMDFYNASVTVLSTQSSRCCVFGCDAAFPETQKNGFVAKYRPLGCIKQNSDVSIPSLCNLHFKRIVAQDRKNKSSRKKHATIWVNPLDKLWGKNELDGHPERECQVLLGDACVGVADVSDHCAEELTIKFCDPRLATHRNVRYKRLPGETIWTFARADADEDHLPREELIVPEE